MNILARTFTIALATAAPIIGANHAALADAPAPEAVLKTYSDIALAGYQDALARAKAPAACAPAKAPRQLDSQARWT